MDAETAARQPRIAFVSGLGFGGATTFLCCLAGEIVRRRIPVIIISPERENAFAADFKTSGVEVVLHDDRRMIFEDRMAAMLQRLAAFQPTTVISCLGQGAYEILRYLPEGVRRFAMIHTDHPTVYAALAPYAAHIDDIVGVSRQITTRLEGMEVFHTASKRYLRHGITVPQDFQPREMHNRPLRLLYFGRLSNGQKRVYLFPTILAGLKQAGIPFQWTIVGEGDQRATLEHAMHSNVPGQKIIFADSVSYHQVPALLQNQDVFLLASDAEGLPLSLLEAMGHGLVPVISNLESGVREVVDSSNGMLVEVNNLEGYAQAIIYLHNNRPELAAKSAAAHARVQVEFSVEAMADRWLGVLTQSETRKVSWPPRPTIHPPKELSKRAWFRPAWRPLRRLLKTMAPSKP